MLNYSPELAMTSVPIKINTIVTSEEKPYAFCRGVLYCNKEGYKKIIETIPQKKE